MENSEQYAEAIADSITNGQHKQSTDQFERALFDAINPYDIFAEMVGLGVDFDAVAMLAHRVIIRLHDKTKRR